ncbi:LysR family transcriptional regulator [Staphylococcus edaphicus]|uniref:LysR family transcriptional regulator n=1 Tax=Staphylococcus edaphicus TaxID=1955013 RepID=A0A2C6WHM3_9STAP|nr:LysR family transcriptional regulator [Staphylococcus edaphicus]PHK50298.1 LysR family transcriptional regulator [Staphylococcus edaphicus]UQW82105.1 LysR family transcriptional regulator [Staphylococcus edaphicus]
MKIIQLEYFVAVVKYNSFTKAANFLHISQPSLTTTIKKMEADLGYDLFMRTTKDIKITEKGIHFYNYAQQLIQNYHQTIEKMYDLNMGHAPKIKISILESTNQWLSQVLSAHSKQYTDQTYLVSEIHDQSKIIELLINFDIHVAFSNEQMNHVDITSVPLYEESYVLLTPKNAFPHAHTTSIASLPLILPTKGSQVRKHLDDYFNRMNLHPNIIIEADRFEAATNFVHRGLGYAVIPRVYYQSFNARDLDALDIRPTLSRSIYINYLKKRKHSSRVLSFIEQCVHYWNFKE